MTSQPSTVTFIATRTKDLTQAHCSKYGGRKKTDGCEGGGDFGFGSESIFFFPFQGAREGQFMELEGSRQFVKLWFACVHECSTNTHTHTQSKLRAAPAVSHISYMLALITVNTPTSPTTSQDAVCTLCRLITQLRDSAKIRRFARNFTSLLKRESSPFHRTDIYMKRTHIQASF